MQDNVNPLTTVKVTGFFNQARACDPDGKRLPYKAIEVVEQPNGEGRVVWVNDASCLKSGDTLVGMFQRRKDFYTRIGYGFTGEQTIFEVTQEPTLQP